MGVKDEIKVCDLGFTLPHEHLFTDLRCYWDVVEYTSDIRRYSRKIIPEINLEVSQKPWAFLDNLVLDNLPSAISEAIAFQAAGGKTIVDASPYSGMGRRPHDLRTVSEKTSLNVIMASGRYTEPSMTDAEKNLSVDDLEYRFLQEFLNGVEGLGVKPGLLKVGFVSSINNPAEIRSLRAAGRVQQNVGCALAVHPHIWQPDSHQILDILEEEGCDLRKVILCHQDYLGDRMEYLSSLVERGCYLEFDTFGSGVINDPMWMCSETSKLQHVVNQIETGNMDRILISGDMCMKIMQSSWGGAGFANIPTNVIPDLIALGIHPDVIHQITVENPARVLCH